MEIKLKWRDPPHDKNCYCAKYPVHTKWYVWPTDILGWKGAQTRCFVWLFWELVIINTPKNN